MEWWIAILVEILQKDTLANGAALCLFILLSDCPPSTQPFILRWIIKLFATVANIDGYFARIFSFFFFAFDGPRLGPSVVIILQLGAQDLRIIASLCSSSFESSNLINRLNLVAKKFSNFSHWWTLKCFCRSRKSIQLVFQIYFCLWTQMPAKLFFGVLIHFFFRYKKKINRLFNALKDEYLRTEFDLGNNLSIKIPKFFFFLILKFSRSPKASLFYLK